MSEQAHRAVAVVGIGAILPDAPDVTTFWQNLQQGRYSIREVPHERWDPADYYDPDPAAPDKSYCKIGAWVREYAFEPFKWRLPIPPAVQEVMDGAQKWAIGASRQALVDYGWPERPLDTMRTAVILGNAMAGEYHYRTSLRIHYPEYVHALEAVPAFRQLEPALQGTLLQGMGQQIRTRIPDITEDTMPGELSNIIAGRVANVLDLHGLNFVTDAACASSLAALAVAVEGLLTGHFDAVLTGGIDRNMDPNSFVKFSKIGALSPDGSRPYAEGANGFVMGEGAAIFLLKRLEDAERGGDRIYAVIRGIGGASDGRGKGITAPNPIGPQRAIERAWRRAGLSPATASYVEGHGTSTRVGDVVEVESMGRVFAEFNLRPGSIPLGSVKSNIGHLKAGAGAAGLLKAVLALHHKALLPHANFPQPNSNIDFDRLPFYVQTELAPWEKPASGDGVRRAGISSFGFGGTNFHVVLEEHVPGMLTSKQTFGAAAVDRGNGAGKPQAAQPKTPYRGALLLGADDVAGLQAQLETVLVRAEAGQAPPLQPPDAGALAAPERLAIDYDDAEELLKRGTRARDALQGDDPTVWRPLSAQGVFRGSGPPGKVAFMFPGQGSQYVNMMRELCELDPVVTDTFREADDVMTPLLGHPLTDYIFVEGEDKEAIGAAEEKLKDTTVTQPAVLTVNVALARLLGSYGVVPDMVIGHSLGEYAALVASGVLSFADALLVVSARGREMSKVSMDDNGCMAAVFAPLPQVEEVLAGIDGYVVLANINSPTQVVIGGATTAVDAAIAAFQAADLRAVKIPVSHAFHTRIVAPASEPLKMVISNMDVRPPQIPIIANVMGERYPETPAEIIDILGQQVASPVQFVKGIETLYREGARIYVEVGPKRVLKALSEDILSDTDDTIILFANHPRKGTLPSLNEALCGLYAAGVGTPRQVIEAVPERLAEVASAALPTHTKRATEPMMIAQSQPPTDEPASPQPPAAPSLPSPAHAALPDDSYMALGRLFADFLEQGQRIYQGMAPAQPQTGQAVATDGKLPLTGSVVVSGAALGLPGQDGKVFNDENVERLLRGEQFIELIPYRHRTAMAEKRINRLVKNPSGAVFEVIDDPADTIKLAGRRGYFDLAAEYGVPESRVEALDISTQLAIAAGIEALRDAGIPLVMRYRTTSKGTFLPDRWMLPEGLSDETGVIFASAFPGLDRMAEEVTRYHEHKSLSDQLHVLQQLRARVAPGPDGLAADLDRRITRLEDEIVRLDYHFDRRFIFRVLAMGHSQFAEYIGARGPNTHVNAACATTTHAMAVAEDWIRSGRCRRVIVIAGDDVTSDNLMGWIGSGLLATGATTTEERLDRAALPFDRRRHGTIIGMGAAAIVVEAEDVVRERGMRGICELLSSQIANSAYHGTRLDVDHISGIMDRVVGQAEERFGIRRDEIAAQTVFISHETYTPARGGSAAAEIHALRHTFGDQASRVVIANTKGYTGHAMGVGIEDILAVKALEHGIVPAVANIHNDFQPDQELGDLNLSRGGSYPVQYALRLGAGFGSQIAMTLMRRIPGELDRVDDQQGYDRWLAAVAGYESARLEIEARTLRIVDEGPPVHPPASSTWVYGHGPTVWAVASATGVAPQARPMPQPTATPGPVVPPAPAPQAVTTPPPAAAVPQQREAPATASAPEPSLAAPPVAAGSAAATPTPAKRSVEAPASTKAPAQIASEGSVADEVLALVSEKTGYPPDMLDLDLDLEADLGIDTVKQAEVFATIRESYDIPRREDLQLRDYNTLAKVIQFVHDNRTDQPQAAAQAPAPAAAPMPVERSVEAGASTEDLVIERMLDPAAGLEAANALLRRVPVPILRPGLDLCKPTGVEYSDDGRMIIVSDSGKAGHYLGYRLRARKTKALVLKEATPETVTAQLEEWLAEGPVDGVYFLTALDVEPPLSQMDVAGWRTEQDKRVKALYTLMRALPEETFLISATRLGGLHGYGAEGATGPLGGAVTGFTKAYARERPETLVKALDFAIEADDRAIAEILVEETLRDPGAVEIGYQDGQRYTIVLEECPVAGAGAEIELNGETVFLITGAAGGITSSIVADLARASGGAFYLTDIAPAPDPENPDLGRLGGDELKYLKRDIAKRIKDSGTRPTPVMVDREIAALERAASLLSAMREIERVGGTVHYRACDVTDADAVHGLVREIAEGQGRVDVLVHAAGLERSHYLADKEPREFNLIFDVKADGLFNLLKATDALDCPLRASVVFTSIAGRFGNAGQTDYSAANDLMCKVTSSMRTTRPATKAIAIDWSAWGKIGMATRGSIPEMMRRAGIDMLDPEAAVPVVRREVISSGTGGEVLIAGSLGILLDPRDPDGGLDLERANAALQHAYPVAGQLTGVGVDGRYTFEAELDPKVQPFLHDHAMDETPLLPGVMGVEGFAEVASLIAKLGGASSLSVVEIDDVQFHAPLKFYRSGARPLTWHARVVPDGKDLRAEVALESSRELKGGNVQQTRHFSGRVRLAPQAEGKGPSTAEAPKWNGAETLAPEAIYRVYFHGPAFQVLGGVQSDGVRVVGRFSQDLPPMTDQERETLVAPLLIELCLQTAGVWEIGKTGVLALPIAIEHVRVHGLPTNGAQLYAEIEPRQGTADELVFDARVLDGEGVVYLEIEGYRTARLPAPVPQADVAPLQALVGGAA